MYLRDLAQDVLHVLLPCVQSWCSAGATFTFVGFIAAVVVSLHAVQLNGHQKNHTQPWACEAGEVRGLPAVLVQRARRDGRGRSFTHWLG